MLRTNEPYVFENFFQAETHLEKQGYHCENEQWINGGNKIATVVPSDNGVQIQPIKH
ncbi:TPA: hypothetical protein ACGU7D_004267 [Vibrio vulnificus]